MGFSYQNRKRKETIRWNLFFLFYCFLPPFPREIVRKGERGACHHPWKRNLSIECPLPRVPDLPTDRPKGCLFFFFLCLLPFGSQATPRWNLKRPCPPSQRMVCISFFHYVEVRNRSDTKARRKRMHSMRRRPSVLASHEWNGSGRKRDRKGTTKVYVEGRRLVSARRRTLFPLSFRIARSMRGKHHRASISFRALRASQEHPFWVYISSETFAAFSVCVSIPLNGT